MEINLKQIEEDMMYFIDTLSKSEAIQTKIAEAVENEDYELAQKLKDLDI